MEREYIKSQMQQGMLVAERGSFFLLHTLSFSHTYFSPDTHERFHFVTQGGGKRFSWDRVWLESMGMRSVFPIILS